MLRAIAAAKKKNDKIDASKIADCLRCDFLPECHMAPTEIRDRRRVLRYRNLVQRQAVQIKNRVSGLLMESGVPYDKLRLHRMGYFGQLMSSSEERRGRGGKGADEGEHRTATHAPDTEWEPHVPGAGRCP
jgi:transposase